MAKPRLPASVEHIFPSEIVHLIYSYVPHVRKTKKEHSPSLQKELMRIQCARLKGVSASYLRDLVAFCLD